MCSTEKCIQELIMSKAVDSTIILQKTGCNFAEALKSKIK